MRHGGDIYRNKVNMDFSVNLSPLPLPGAASDMIASAMLTGLEEAINYPDPGQYEVRESLTLSDNVDSDCIYAGSGASELIMACIRAVNPTDILIPLPCYTGYIHAVNALYSMQTSDSFTENTHIIRYYLKKEDDYRLTGDILNHMSDNIDLMFLTDPWNPGGANIEDGLLISILKKASDNGIRVILDQSFLFMSDKVTRSPSSAGTHELITKYDNLFIIRSYTKLFALPGIRMGYIISASNNITEIKKQLPEWNLSSVASKAMIACSDIARNTSFINDNISQINKERDYLMEELKQLGFRVFHSDTAFILFESGYELYTGLLEHGILIRDCSDYEGLGNGFYRIAVKDHRSNVLLINSIRTLLQRQNM